MARHCLCHCYRASCASGVVCRSFQSPAAAWPVRFSLGGSPVAPGPVWCLDRSALGFLPIVLGIGIVLIGIFAAAYPSLRGLISFSREGAFSLSLLALSLLAAVFLAPIAWRELHYQWAGAIAHDEHSLNYHWLTSVLLAVLLVLAGVLSSTKRPGWQFLGLITGVTYLYLGIMALLLPYYAGSWGVIGGIVGLLAGLAYITATLVAARRSRQVTPSTTTAMGSTSS